MRRVAVAPCVGRVTKLGGLETTMSYREAHCWACACFVASSRNARCGICGWLRCHCGACGCGYRSMIQQRYGIYVSAPVVTAIGLLDRLSPRKPEPEPEPEPTPKPVRPPEKVRGKRMSRLENLLNRVTAAIDGINRPKQWEIDEDELIDEDDEITARQVSELLDGAADLCTVLETLLARVVTIRETCPCGSEFHESAIPPMGGDLARQNNIWRKKHEHHLQMVRTIDIVRDSTEVNDYVSTGEAAPAYES